MDLRGLVLIGFSAACIGVAGLAYQESKRKSMSRGLALATAGFGSTCMRNGFDTTAGRVGCLTQTSFGLLKTAIGAEKSYRGGGAFGN